MTKKDSTKTLDIKHSMDIINKWNEHLDKNIRKEKYKKMAQSPYYFFRGTNFLFWEYFAKDIRLSAFGSDKTKTWIQADLHAYNYGIYDNGQGDLVYGLNDFDESCIADFQFDLWRMAASMILIAHENGFQQKELIETFVNAFSASYFDKLKLYAENGANILHETTKENAFGKLDEVLKQVERKENRREMLKQWTTHDAGNLVFDLSYPKLGSIPTDKKEEIKKALHLYINTLTHNKNLKDDYFKVIDVAQRISSGTGSYGTPRYYILIQAENDGKYKQRILDAKFQYKPCAYTFLNDNFRETYDTLFLNEGHRHKLAHESLSSCPDKHLGWMELSEGIFSVRERSPYKSYFPANLLNTEKRFIKLALQWGSILATAHIKANEHFEVTEVTEQSLDNRKKLIGLISTVAFEYVEFSNTIYKSFISKFFLNEP